MTAAHQLTLFLASEPRHAKSTTTEVVTSVVALGTRDAIRAPEPAASYTETAAVLDQATGSQGEGRSRRCVGGTTSRRPSALPGALTLADERDAALARHMQDEHKRRLREAADSAARFLIAREGSTCSPRVVAELYARGLGHLLLGLDRRALGSVFLKSRGYERTGEWTTEGSKCRPVPLWRLAR